MLIMSLRAQQKFTKIDNNVIHDSRLSHGAKTMYCMMQSFPVGKHASNIYFMKALSVSERTVTRLRTELISIGLLEVEKISRREYRAFLGTSTVSGLEVKRRYYKDELHTTQD